MDIDIDFPTAFDPRTVMKQAIPASMVRNGELVKHNCGHYFQAIPVDAPTNIAAIPYDQAAELGYFKIDFLHLSCLDVVKDKTELRELSKKAPDLMMVQLMKMRHRPFLALMKMRYHLLHQNQLIP